MTKQITIEEALKLVSFTKNDYDEWEVEDVRVNVNGDVYGTVHGDVEGSVNGHVHGDIGGDVEGSVNGYVGGDVYGNVHGDVGGNVEGDIKSGEWQRVESPRQKLKRLIEETNNSELIEAFNQLEDNTV